MLVNNELHSVFHVKCKLMVRICNQVKMYNADLRCWVIYLKCRYMLDIGSIALVLNISPMNAKCILARFVTSANVKKWAKLEDLQSQHCIHTSRWLFLTVCRTAL